MDFLSLSSEYESCQDYFNNSMKTLESFHSFFDVVYKNLSQFTNGTHVALQAIFTDLTQYDNHSSFSKNFFAFYNIFEKFLSKTKQMSEKINYELVEPTQLILNHLQEKNNYWLTEMKELINYTIEQKRLHDTAKHNYFNSCRVAEKQEAKVLKSLDDKEKAKGKENEVEKQHNTLVQLRTLAENNCQKYKTVLKITNDSFEQNNQNYFPLINNLKDNEESRYNFLKYHFEKFNSFIDDIGKSFNVMCASLKESLIEINVEEDMKLFNEKFSYCNKNKERITKEDFLQYDIYRRNLEALIRTNHSVFNKSAIKIPMKKINNYSIKQPVVKLKHYSFELKEEMLIASLFSDTEIDTKNISAFESKLKSNHHFAKDFIDKLLEKFQRSIQIKIDLHNKMILFAYLIRDVLLNEKISKDMFDLNYAIVYIAEKAFYISQEGNKVYLCRILSDLCSNFKSKQFWHKLILMKINTELKAKTRGDNNKKEKTDGKLGYVKGAIGFIFSSGQSKEETHKGTVNNLHLKDVCIIIKDFLFHLSNFSLDSNDANDILIDLASTFKLTDNQLSLCVSIINSNLYSIKCKSNTHHSVKKPLLFNEKIIESNFLQKKAFKNDKSCRYGIIMNALKYLPYREYINIISLNSTYQKKVSKYIYQSLLWDNLLVNENQRVSIWMNILSYRSLARYHSSVASAKNLSQTIIDSIQMDTRRTTYTNEQSENQKKTYNILTTLSYLYPNIGYCQGMNYICCFLINIINDEEKSFESFNALLTKSKYSKLIEKDFFLLKKYFYVFDRLLSIYMPEVFNHLKKNAIFSNFFIAPWFITLFTDSYSYLPKEQTPKTLLRIFDLFMLGGWNAIINVSLSIIKHYESQLIKMKFEELLHFLINDIIKYDFFHVDNYEKFVSLYNSVKVPSGLISNLENECHLEKKIKRDEELLHKINEEKETMTSI